MHRVLLTVLVSGATSLALVVGTVATANADDPEAEKERVEQQLAENEDDLRESTAAVAAAGAALAQVEDQLAVARDTLATAIGALDAARAEEQRLAGELAAAAQEETSAEAELVAIQADIDANEAVMSAMARSAYQGSQLSSVSTMLDATSLSDYTARAQGMRSVLLSQSATVAALADDRAQQASTQARLEAVRERIAAARAAAAAVVVEKDRLRQEAADATAEVERLHAEREQILVAAEDALAEDEAEHAALEAERGRLEQLLRERAAAQAAAAAAAKAAAEAAAQAAAAAAAAAAEQEPEPLSAPAPQPVAAAPPSSSDFYRPVGGWITSHYGMRVHPITGTYKLHDGTDFGSACGTPVRAAAGGTVLRTSYAGGYGNQVVIEHGNIDGEYVATSYNHLSGYAAGDGERVDRGEVIGFVGTTGMSTGCHLHFMVFVNGSTTNPMNFL